MWGGGGEKGARWDTRNKNKASVRAGKGKARGHDMGMEGYIHVVPFLSAPPVAACRYVQYIYTKNEGNGNRRKRRDELD